MAHKKHGLTLGIADKTNVFCIVSMDVSNQRPINPGSFDAVSAGQFLHSTWENAGWSSLDGLCLQPTLTNDHADLLMGKECFFTKLNKLLQ